MDGKVPRLRHPKPKPGDSPVKAAPLLEPRTCTAQSCGAGQESQDRTPRLESLSASYKDNKQKCFDGEGEGGPGLREPWSRPVDSPRSVGSPGPSGHMVKGGSPTLRPLDSTAFLTEFRMAMVLGDMGLLSQRHQ